jgi:hypothetical protein
MHKTKQMANQIKKPADVWELEYYLTERRKEINRKYDYRYSQLHSERYRLITIGNFPIPLHPLGTRMWTPKWLSTPP